MLEIKKSFEIGLEIKVGDRLKKSKVDKWFELLSFTKWQPQKIENWSGQSTLKTKIRFQINTSPLFTTERLKQRLIY